MYAFFGGKKKINYQGKRKSTMYMINIQLKIWNAARKYYFVFYQSFKIGVD